MSIQPGAYMPQNYQKAINETGLETYLAHMCLYPVHINVKRFSTIHNPMPDDMWMARIGKEVKEASLKNGEAHLKTSGWEGVNALDGTAKGKTMVICGSGYSILKNVKELQRLKSDNMVVVAINGALKAMPPGMVDIYFTLDWLSNRSWWAGIDPVALHPGVKAVLGLPAPAELAEVFPERFYFPANYVVANPEGAKAFSEKHGFLAEAELATHSVMHLAYRMGCSKIVLLGHDFSCPGGPGGNYYHWDELLNVKHSSGQDWKVVPDLHGNGTITSDMLLKNAHIINATGQSLYDDGVVVLNSTEGGILGMPLSLPLEQALAYKDPRCQMSLVA